MSESGAFIYSLFTVFIILHFKIVLYLLRPYSKSLTLEPGCYKVPKRHRGIFYKSADLFEKLIEICCNVTRWTSYIGYHWKEESVFYSSVRGKPYFVYKYLNFCGFNGMERYTRMKVSEE